MADPMAALEAKREALKAFLPPPKFPHIKAGLRVMSAYDDSKQGVVSFKMERLFANAHRGRKAAAVAWQAGWLAGWRVAEMAVYSSGDG